MATQAVKVKNEESQGNAITGAASGIGQKVTGAYQDSRQFLHDVRVEMKQVTWPTREDVVLDDWRRDRHGFLLWRVSGDGGLARTVGRDAHLQNFWRLKGIIA